MTQQNLSYLRLILITLINIIFTRVLPTRRKKAGDLLLLESRWLWEASWTLGLVLSLHIKTITLANIGRFACFRLSFLRKIQKTEGVSWTSPWVEANITVSTFLWCASRLVRSWLSRNRPAMWSHSNLWQQIQFRLSSASLWLLVHRVLLAWLEYCTAIGGPWTKLVLTLVSMWRMWCLQHFSKSFCTVSKYRLETLAHTACQCHCTAGQSLVGLILILFFGVSIL